MMFLGLEIQQDSQKHSYSSAAFVYRVVMHQGVVYQGTHCRVRRRAQVTVLVTRPSSAPGASGAMMPADTQCHPRGRTPGPQTNGHTWQACCLLSTSF